MSTPKLKIFPIQPRLPLLAAAMQSCVGILCINWVLQGLRGMDSKEVSFRLGLWLALALTISEMALRAGRPPAMALLAGAIIAHTINYTLNGQLWVCCRYCRFWHREPAALDRWLAATAQDLKAIPWLDEALCIGSQGAGAGTRGPRADIDLRVIVPPGLLGWWRCGLLLLRLRSRAFLRRIPLDLYAYDQPASLLRFRQDEPLLIIKDRRGHLARELAHRRLVLLP